MSSYDYCAKCGKLIDMYNPKHDCIKEPVNFEELRVKERTLLLAAFDYGVDAEGYVLTSSGDRIPSKENPEECLKIEKVMILPKEGGGIDIRDGTPTSVSKYMREIEEAEEQ